jgi:CBS-domain-containing membrane protein
MTADPATCGPEEALTRAAAVMWHQDCGAVPIVDVDGRVLGMITDRDICIALASQNTRARGVRISEVMSADPVTCQADDSIALAALRMAENQVHRLPVTNAEGVLEGIITLSDLLRLAGRKGKKSERISRKEMLVVIQAINSPRIAPEAIVEPVIPAEAVSTAEAH